MAQSDDYNDMFHRYYRLGWSIVDFGTVVIDDRTVYRACGRHQDGREVIGYGPTESAAKGDVARKIDAGEWNI